MANLSIENVRDELRERLGNYSQEFVKANMLLGGIEESLRGLASKGVLLGLTKDVEIVVGPEWPKMYRHKDGKTLVVASPEMAKNLTSGWEPNMPKSSEEMERMGAAEADSTALTLGIGQGGKPEVQGGEKGEEEPVHLPVDPPVDLQNFPKPEEQH